MLKAISFSSLSYAFFVLAVLALSLVVRRPRWRQAALLAASYLFYATWNPGFLLLLVASSFFNHHWAKVLRTKSTAAHLWIGLGVNLAPLAALKYLPAVFVGSAQGLDWVIPIGVSFYTFQAISYLLDTYRDGRHQPTWLEFHLYMAFWPTILSGPICRLPEMLPQYRAMATPSSTDVSVGVQRIALGLFMKVVVANTLANGFAPGSGVVAGFGNAAATWNTVDVLALCAAYGFQIFFDFAGYSHVAIGSARLFGLRLRENFDHPYLAVNISDFWNRWHMSLSSWIRDYLFFPLATARPGTGWRLMALVVSMALFGLWHGPAATFVLWGIYHGLLLAAHRWFQGKTRRRANLRGDRGPAKLAGWLATLAAVTLGWILFRSSDLAQAALLFTALVNPGAPVALSGEFYRLLGWVAAGYFAVAVPWVWLRGLRDRPAMSRLAELAAPVWSFALILLVIIWSDASSPFVYVRF